MKNILYITRYSATYYTVYYVVPAPYGLQSKVQALEESQYADPVNTP
jgi:hypothetical protein